MKKYMKTIECKTVLFYLLIITASLMIGYMSFRRDFDFDIFPSLYGDSTSMSAAVKSIQENGLYGMWFNARIGAPEVAAPIDGSAVDIILSLIIWVLSIFIKSTSRIQYVYFILTFALNSVSMALLLRKIKVNYETAFVCSLLYTAAPYHFGRGLGHLVLTNYMYFAIAVYLSFVILGLIEENTDRWKIWICCILLGLGFAYYYAFGLIVMATAYIVSFIKYGKKEVFKKLWIMALLLLSIFISLLPKIGYSILNGKNPIILKRIFFEQEIYGLKIIQLLLPPSTSRFSALRALEQEYSSQAPLVNENVLASLGLVASIGFLALCAAFFLSFASKNKKEGNEWLVIDFLSLSTLVLILMGTIGGFGEIFNYLVTPQIRCYNRTSIYIAGLSLIMIAVLFDKIKRKNRSIYYIVCAFVLSIGMIDQTVDMARGGQQAAKQTQKAYEKFFAKVEQQLDKEDMVYQLPHMDYPEVGGSFEYRHFIGYLFTDTLKWSYGGIKGRNVAAAQLNIDEGMSYWFLKEIKDAGFSAVYIDLAGYEDGGDQVLSFYKQLGIEPTVSEDGMLYMYDISNLIISEEEALPGYAFVSEWNDTYNLNLDIDKKADLAQGLTKMDQHVYSKLYAGIAQTDIVRTYTDVEYIDFLYSALLGRIEADEERESWILAIQNGLSRKQIFESFLNSEEFRKRQGFDEITE